MFQLKINFKESAMHHRAVVILVSNSFTLDVTLVFDLVVEVRANLAGVVAGFETTGKVLLVDVLDDVVLYSDYAVLVMLPLDA